MQLPLELVEIPLLAVFLQLRLCDTDAVHYFSSRTKNQSNSCFFLITADSHLQA